MWLWFWVGVCVARAPLGPPHLPVEEEVRYELIRSPKSFLAAKSWCRQRQARLLHSWDEHARGALQSLLEDGSKSWICSQADVSRERRQQQPSNPDYSQEFSSSAAAAAAACDVVIRRGGQFWARREDCAQELFFICQSEPPEAQQAAASKSRKTEDVLGPPHRTPRDVSMPQRRSTCRRFKCGQMPRSTAAPWGQEIAPQSLPPGATAQPRSSGSSPRPPPAQPATATQCPLSLTAHSASSGHPPQPTWPAGGTQAALRSEATTPEPSASPQPPTLHDAGVDSGPRSHTATSPAPLTFHPPEAPAEATAGQALERLLGKLNQTVQSLPGHRLVLEMAAQELQNLTSSPALLSGDAQASASCALAFLSSQLLKETLATSTASHPGMAAAASSALFQALGNLLQATDSSSGTQQQEEATLEKTLAALPLIQAGLLLGHSSLAVDSPVLSTTLSSCPAASLPHRSFHLPQPWPVTVTFPSGPALAPFLHQHSHLQVQVASFARNPFRRLDGKPVGSVTSIALAASEEPIQVHDLTEEMEIGFGVEEAGGSPASLGKGAGRFGLEVNVTAMEQALLVSVRPSTPLRIFLRLGSQPHGNSSLLNTTLPRGPWKEEGAYVWVIPPEELRLGRGTYYISAEVDPSSSQGHWNLSIHLASAGCYYWARQQRAWRSDGCRVGPQSSLSSTRCLCSHLSFFGRVFLVLPHVVHLQHLGQLLRRVDQNPAGVALLTGLLLSYGAALIWARRRQRADAGKVQVTVLADSEEAGSSSLYLVQVFTGYRRGASTSAKVTLTLYGAEGRSEPHLLQHPEAPCFEWGGMDAFLLATRTPLGALHAIRLWHDNAGPSPSWFVRRLVVHDLRSRKKWHFLCGCWLAADLDDGQLDRVFVAASEGELLSFRHLFWAGLAGKLTQEHLWLSVVTCSPWSPFTRVQRLSCCLALLLCSMLINIMFWKETPTGGGHPEPGPFVVTWQEVVVSVEASILLLPAHLLIAHIFQLVQPPALEPPPASTQRLQPVVPPRQALSIAHLEQALTETLSFLYKNPLCQRTEADGFPGALKHMPELVSGLRGLICSHLRHPEDPGAPLQERCCHLHRYLCCEVSGFEARLRALDWSSRPDAYDYLHAVDQLHRLWQQLEQQLEQEQQQGRPSTDEPSSTGPGAQANCLSIPDPEEERASLFRRLPSQFGFICWLVLGATSLAAAFFTVLYSLQMDREQAAHWVITILLSVLQSVLLVQPLKVLALTALFSLLRRRELWQDKGQEQELRRRLGLVTGRFLRLAPPGSRDWASPLYQPPALTPTAPQKDRTTKERKLCSVLQEIAVQLVFLAVLMVLSYSERGPHEFHLNSALQKTFTSELDNIRTAEELYRWARWSLLPSVYGDPQGSAMGGNSVLVGSLRLRQIRASEAPQRPGPALLQLQQESEADVLQMAAPAPSWGPPGLDESTGQGPWVYQSESTLKEYPIWGKLALYPGSGYLADLGTNASHANSVLQHLEQHHWLDGGTRAIFMEFVIYNANVNLFCAITLILETNGIGALLSKAELQILRLYPNVKVLAQLACADITFLLLLLYYILVQGQRLKQQKWRYFGCKGNLLDASTILISVAVIGLYVKRGLLAQNLLKQHRQDRTRFLSFYETVEVDSALTYLIAFLVALTTIKLWNLLRLNPRMHLITQTLQKAWDEVLGFLLTLLVLLTGYSIGCNLMFGWSISDYETFFDSGVTIVGLLIGIFDYEEVIALDPVLGSVLIVTGVFSMVFVIINLFVSALLTTFSREMKAAKASKDESMMQLIQLKISALFGIKQQALKKARD